MTETPFGHSKNHLISYFLTKYLNERNDILSNSAALVWTPPDFWRASIIYAFSISSICLSRSIPFSGILPLFVISLGFNQLIFGGSRSGLISSVVSKATALSIVFSSSLTLPGQSYCSRQRNASWLTRKMDRCICKLNFVKKWWARTGMSSFLSLSGGISKGITLTR